MSFSRTLNKQGKKILLGCNCVTALGETENFIKSNVLVMVVRKNRITSIMEITCTIDWLIIIISGVIDTCKGRSRDSRILYTDTLSQLTLNPAPSGSGGQNPRHRNVGGSCIGIN